MVAFVYTAIVFCVGGGALLWWGMRWVRSGLHREAVCAKCGYPARGLPGLFCPECGSDLREVGIRPPGAVRPLGVIPVAAAWTVFLAFAGLVVMFPLGAVVRPWEELQMLTYYYAGPSSGLYDEAYVGTVGSRTVWPWSSRVQPIPLCVVSVHVLRQAAPGVTISAEPNSGWRQVQLISGMVAEPGDVDEGAILKAVERCGIGAPTPQLEAEARELAEAVRLVCGRCANAPATAAFAGVTARSNQSFHDVGWFNWAALLAWGFVWFSGCAYLFWPRRKARRIKN